MLIMMNGDNKMNMKRDNVGIIRIILDLQCSDGMCGAKRLHRYLAKL